MCIVQKGENPEKGENPDFMCLCVFQAGEHG